MNYVSVNFLQRTHTTYRDNPNTLIVPQKLSAREKMARLLRKVSTGLFLLSFILAGFVYGPKVYAYIDQQMGSEWVQVLTRPSTSFGETLVSTGDKEPEKPYQPTLDTTLPTENKLIIEKIGVNSPIGEDVVENIEETLKHGAWRVSEFGTPFSRKYPTILAAHRFGYLEWNNEYRRERSFYNLPKLEVGDTVHVIWNQRRYVYQVIEESEGEEITNYQADLILYTCKFLDSKERLFTYAKLLEV